MIQEPGTEDILTSMDSLPVDLPLQEVSITSDGWRVRRTTFDDYIRVEIFTPGGYLVSSNYISARIP